jgi:GxxExxY protein
LFDSQIPQMKRSDGFGAIRSGDQRTYSIIGAAMEVHRVLGAGFLELVYQAALELELGMRAIPYDREVEVPVFYKESPLGVRYRADFVCYGEILVELKALDRLTRREETQVIHYLVAGRLGCGLLLNFGAQSLQFRRFVGPAHRLAFPAVQSVKSVDPVVQAP